MRASLHIRAPRRELTPCGRLVLGRTIQSGAHGTVRTATPASAGGKRRRVAVKIAHSDPESVHRLVSEARILSRLPRHRNVVGVYHDLPASRDRHTGAVFLPMQLCDTDLLELLLYRPLPAETLAGFAAQLTAALRHCHAHGVAHLDVKPENVLVSLAEGQLKLADFGMAAVVTDTQERDFAGQHGSASYAAPEVWNYGPESAHYSAFAADVWSLGAVLFTMVHRRRPWTDVTLADRDYRHYVSTGEFLRYEGEEDMCTSDMDALLRAMMHLDPSKRPSLEAVAAFFAAATKPAKAAAAATPVAAKAGPAVPAAPVAAPAAKAAKTRPSTPDEVGAAPPMVSAGLAKTRSGASAGSDSSMEVDSDAVCLLFDQIDVPGAAVVAAEGDVDMARQ